MPYVNDNGEVCDCPRCKRLDELLDEKDLIIEELQKDIRRWALRLGKARREDESGGWKQHHLYSRAETVFKEWKRACNHPRSPFTRDRFMAVLPFLENEKYGLPTVMMAISGAAFDPWVTKRKNGTPKRHDDWSKIFKNADEFEEFVNRAPSGEGPALKVVA